MFNNDSYKLSFVFAIIIHVVLMFFLISKSSSSRPIVAFSSPYNFINATTINQRDFDNRVVKKFVVKGKPPVKQNKAEVEKPKKVVKPNATSKKTSSKNKNMKNLLQKSLLAEQEKEMAELKKQREKYKKEQAKKRQEQVQESLQNDLLEEKRQLAALQEEAHERRMQGEVDRYKALIIQAISSEWNWVVSEGDDSNLVCKLLINVAPGGAVLEVQLVKNSGNEALDRSAQAAVLKASPLPVPEDSKLFDRVRTIILTARPEGIVGG